MLNFSPFSPFCNQTHGLNFNSKRESQSTFGHRVPLNYCPHPPSNPILSSISWSLSTSLTLALHLALLSLLCRRSHYCPSRCQTFSSARLFCRRRSTFRFASTMDANGSDQTSPTRFIPNGSSMVDPMGSTSSLALNAGTTTSSPGAFAC